MLNKIFSLSALISIFVLSTANASDDFTETPYNQREIVEVETIDLPPADDLYQVAEAFSVPHATSSTEVADLNSSSTKPTTNSPGAKTGAKTPPPATPPAPIKQLVVKKVEEKKIIPATSDASQYIYMHPGMIAYRDSKWIGGDHLLNISKNIPVVVELLVPQGKEMSLTEGKLKGVVAGLFQKAGLTTSLEFSDVTPPLPFFHVLIMIHPIDRGYVACCDGRLFEDAHLLRVNLDPGTAVQAITWEKQNLLIIPEKELDEQLVSAVEDITTTFTSRFEAYEKIKQRQVRE